MYYITYMYNAISYNILEDIKCVYHVSSMRTLDYRADGLGQIPAPA